jgi:hypothetical protein
MGIKATIDIVSACAKTEVSPQSRPQTIKITIFYFMPQVAYPDIGFVV